MAIVKAKGIMTFNPNEKAPSFVLGTIVISVNQLKEWLNNEGKEYLTDYKGEPQLKLQVTSVKEGRGIMVAVDTWKPTPKDGNASKQPEWDGGTTRNGITNNHSDDLPF